MAGGALGPLVRHPVHRWLLAPALGVGAAAGLGLRVLSELREEAVADGVHVSVLLLAMATAVSVVDPAGSIADAAPARLATRRAVRTGMVLGAVGLGWALAIVGPPSSLRPPVTWLTADLAVLCAVVLAAAAAESRADPRTAEPLAAAVGVAMAWSALRLLQPSWSPFTPAGDHRWSAAVGVAAVLALGAASSDPARPPWRSLRRRRHGRAGATA